MTSSAAPTAAAGRKAPIPRGKRASARHGLTTASVNIHVRNPAQLFNSLDPSPFWDRDLDRAAASFIEEEFSDKRSADLWHLNVHVTEGDQLANDLQTAIESYYERNAASARRELREHRLTAELALLAGVTLFVLCMVARQLLLAAVGDVSRVLDEGLIVLAWLALWRPAEALLYEWVPLYRKRRLYERLAGIRVSIRAHSPEAPSSLAAKPVPQTN
jgi:hypothetical protein